MPSSSQRYWAEAKRPSRIRRKGKDFPLCRSGPQLNTTQVEWWWTIGRKKNKVSETSGLGFSFKKIKNLLLNGKTSFSINPIRFRKKARENIAERFPTFQECRAKEIRLVWLNLTSVRSIRKHKIKSWDGIYEGMSEKSFEISRLSLSTSTWLRLYAKLFVVYYAQVSVSVIERAIPCGIPATTRRENTRKKKKCLTRFNDYGCCTSVERLTNLN